MSTRVWFENDAIQMDGVGTLPARSLYTVIDGARVHILTLSDVRLSQLTFDQYATKAGAAFASAAAAKTYLDGEFAKAPTAAATTISGVTGLQSALDGKQATGNYAPLSHVSDTANPHAVTKAQVGLGNADNTSDANKPISTATQTALNAKANTSHTHAIADVAGLQAALDGKLGTAVTPSVPTRALGTAFQPSATKAVLASYSVETTATNPLVAGASSAVVTLLSDANSPPTTERARASAKSSVGLAVAVAITTANVTPLTYLVPPGHFVRLVSTVTGTGSTAIISQTEEVLG